jgi:hypothetical protein
MILVKKEIMRGCEADWTSPAKRVRWVRVAAIFFLLPESAELFRELITGPYYRCGQNAAAIS